MGVKLGETQSFAMPEFVGLPRASGDDAAWRIRLEGRRLGNVHSQADGDADFRYTLTVGYGGDRPRAEGRLRYRVFVREHEVPRVLGTEEVGFTLSAGEEKAVAIDFSRWVSGFGIYYVEAEVFEDSPAPAASCLYSLSRVLLPEEKDDRFGMCLHFPYEGKYTKELVPQLAKLGVRFIRTDFGWIEAEKEPGVIRIPAYWDEYVYLAKELGVEMLAIVDYGNPFYDEGGAPYSEEGLAAFRRYCTHLASHYKGVIKHYEIWNEYNIIYANPTHRLPETYGAMVKVAYEAIKAVDPEALVVGIDMCGIHFEWMRRVLETGALSSMDAVSFHPYCSYPSPAFPDDGWGQMRRNIEEVRDLTIRYGDEKPVWITEMGWASYRDPGGVTREVQAADAVRMFALGMAGRPGDHVIWYDFINDEFDKYEREHQFGIVEAYDASVRLAAKEAFAALGALFHKLGGAACDREVRLGRSVRLFEMHRGNEEPTAIFWALEGAEVLTVKAAGETVRLTDMYGNSKELHAVDGMVTFPATELPQYADGLAPGYEQGRAPVAFEQAAVACVAGETVRLRVCGAQELRIQPVLPAGFTAKRAGDCLEITAPEGAAEREYPFTADFFCGEDMVARLPGCVTVVPAMEVVVKPVSAGGNWCLGVTVENHSNCRAVSGRFRITEPEKWRRQTKTPDYNDLIHNVRLSESARYEAPPLGTTSLLFGLPADLGEDLHLLGTEILPDEGASIYAYHRLSFFGVPKRKGDMVIDGRATREKWGEPQIVLGEKDFVPGRVGAMQPHYGAEVFLRWDEEYFYFGARVRDAVHHQDCTCGDMWQDLWDGDGIQLLLDPVREKRNDHTNYNEIGIARTSNTDQVVVWRWRTPHGRGVQIMKDVPCEVVREGVYTMYEAAFSWDTLLPAGVHAGEGKDFGFSLGINDNNGEGCVGRLVYHLGIGYWYDQEGYNPQLCGDMVLLP